MPADDSDLLLDGDHIRQYLLEVADQMEPTGPAAVIIVVGGSLLAWHGLRPGTKDIDSIARLDAELARAAEQIRDRHDLAPNWLNDNAAMFYPQGLRESDCEVLMDHARLRVLGPPLRFVFAMKLLRGEAADWQDLLMLWPRCGFSSAEQAAEFFHSCYPHLEHDPYLVKDLQRLAKRAS